MGGDICRAWVVLYSVVHLTYAFLSAGPNNLPKSIDSAAYNDNISPKSYRWIHR